MSDLAPQNVTLQTDQPQQNVQQMLLPGFPGFHQVSTQIHLGPIPPPEILAGYEKAVPGSGDRIIKMAEQQATHRQQLETNGLLSQTADRHADRLEHRIGQIFALVIGVAALIASAVIAISVPSSGGATVASIIGGSTVVGLVTVFVVGNRNQKQDSKNEPKKTA